MGSIKNILWVAFISMVPIIELRGAIPAGYLLDLPWYSCMLASVVGNCIPVPFILLFIRAILDWMKRCPIALFAKIALWLERKANKHADKVNSYAFWGLLILVAIPLPGTGAWTGALVAALFRVKPKIAVPAIILGVIGAAIIVTLISYGALSVLAFLI
ncbi:MAG: small multi-drug export protein [Clostridia bacterium]|nr:small multi-drug export protein [Clostridia bacterium]